MKGLKLSKTSWLILSAGVFLVILAGLGLTRSQQVKEQSALNDELATYEKRLALLQTSQLSQHLENLKVQIEENEAQVEDAKARLEQTVISVDVADELYKIAEYCSVNITNFTSSVISESKYEGIAISTISLSAVIEGAKQNVVDFVQSVNNGFVTGNVATAQVTFGDAEPLEEPSESEESEEQEPVEGEELATGMASARISILIYSYEDK